MNSDTPKTDANIAGKVRLYPQSLCEVEVVTAEFCRTLERESSVDHERIQHLRDIQADRDRFRDAYRNAVAIASRLAECGDPKPWAIEGWQITKQDLERLSA